MIKAVNLSRSYGRKLVFRDINFCISQGERVWLRGDNGSGKTTLLKILASNIYPSSGDVWVGGSHTRNHRNRASKQVALAPANPEGLYRRLSGRQNLYLFNALRGTPSAQTDTLIEEWSSIKTFEEALGTPFLECSSGMKQILSLALAFTAKSPVLLLDEPFQALDQKTREILQGFIKRSSQTMIMTTHQSEDVRDLCNSVYTLECGKLRPLGGC